MYISITNGYEFQNRVEAVKNVRVAYATYGMGKLGLKEALEFVRDGKEIEIDDVNANIFVNALRSCGFNMLTSMKISTITPELIINHLFQKYLETNDVAYIYAACEMKKTFGIE